MRNSSLMVHESTYLFTLQTMYQKVRIRFIVDILFWLPWMSLNLLAKCEVGRKEAAAGQLSA